MTVGFELDGQVFTALNGGPVFKFTEAIWLVVNCDTHKQIDTYWDKLCADGGKPLQCGWLKDKYGLSWQIVPSILPKLMQDTNKSERVMQALMQMVKLDIKTLQQAYDAK
jgi:predicted 3-demethylubiquinone-9 3-methyltransferase (glyoxalase superfamily)